MRCKRANAGRSKKSRDESSFTEQDSAAERFGVDILYETEEDSDADVLYVTSSGEDEDELYCL